MKLQNNKKDYTKIYIGNAEAPATDMNILELRPQSDGASMEAAADVPTE